MRWERLRSLYRRWLPFALGLTVAANLVLEQDLPISARSIRFHHDGSLTHLVHNDQLTVARWFGLYMEIGDAAAGGTLIVPRISPLSADIAEGLSGVTVVVEDYDPRALPAEALPREPPIGTFATPEGDVPYWVLPGAHDRWWLGFTPEGIVVVPESLHARPGIDP